MPDRCACSAVDSRAVACHAGSARGNHQPVPARRAADWRTLPVRKKTAWSAIPSSHRATQLAEVGTRAIFAHIPLRTGFVGESRYGLLNDARKLSKTVLPLMVE